MRMLCAAVGALVLLMLVYSVLELVLPGGRLRPYVRLLTLLSLLATAVSLLGGRDWSLNLAYVDDDLSEQRQLGQDYADLGQRLTAELAAELAAEQTAEQEAGQEVADE